ncbi:hypothetical protein SELMODRAFT_445238 [Selaginella moellendorffii]|uniref:RING-type E3 ubiquitin transferase n=1 Tax=Selaginella moellendorffii TaxID=88036 RepID=D8SH25_SELML|nr:U-box domain-containing protein 43 [Selaginella moellendorffii]EFJ16305.1 hypothetical protein SELMODRAFT_445238 [Selaginella moellendorffii]|eukprot:XP_002982552.1 U-box domain-containing protein 43 [Selaginella moellendorffii]
MDDKAVSEHLVHEILCLIDALKAGVNEIGVNKSLFLKSTLFLVEFKQLSLGQCPANALLKILDDVTGLVRLTEQCCRRKSRVFQIYKSQEISQRIRDIMLDFTSHLDLCSEVENMDQIMELRNRVTRATFSPDPRNGELATALSDAISHEDDELQSKVVDDISRHLAASVSSLKEELLEDKRQLEVDGRVEELSELEKLVQLLDSAPSLESDSLALDDSFVSEDIPASYLCPITGQLMREPVLVEGGVTYEKSAIMEWINRGNTKCPVTNADLSSVNLVRNRSIENAIRQYLGRVNIDKLTRSIKKIKLERVHVEETLDTIKNLIGLGSCFKRHVVALDGLEPLVAILKSSAGDQRAKILQILLAIGESGDDCKIHIAEVGAVPVVLRILTKCHGDCPDAVSLLREISEVQQGKEVILAQPGSIIVIASAATVDSVEQKDHAMKLLENLCSNKSWVAIEAASTGVFDFLINNLHTGNEAVKLEMAEAIATKLEFNDASSAALVSTGILVPLVEMLKSESLDSKMAATRCIQKLSSTVTNRDAIGDAGAIPLIAGLATMAVRDLKVYALETLANLASTRECVPALATEENVPRLLEMVKDGDLQVQSSILKILHSLSRESKTVRLMVRQHAEVIRYLLDASSEHNSGPRRTSVLGVIVQLAADRDTRDAIQPSSSTVMSFVRLLDQAAATSTEDKELALGILSGITKNGSQARQVLAAGGAYGIIISCMQTGSPRMKEEAAAVLTRLTDSVLDANSEQELARLGVMRLLRDTLETGSERAREHACANLANLSKRTPSLTQEQSFFKRLLARLGLKQYRLCVVHPGKCNARASFCMVEAGVVPLLIGEIRGSNARNAERGMDALLTLVQDESFRIKGVDFLVKNNAIAAAVSLVGRSSSLTEKAMVLLERIFKCRKYRDDTYSRIAKSSLSTTMTSGSIGARKSAAKALMHLGMMAKGSTYTATGESATVN